MRKVPQSQVYFSASRGDPGMGTSPALGGERGRYHARSVDMVEAQGRRGTLVRVLLLVTAAFVVYSNAWRAPFVFDDAVHIVDAPGIRQIGPASKYLNDARPLVTLTFALNYALGELNPAGYRLLNVAIHALSGCVLMLLIDHTVATRQRAAPWFGFVAALLWVVHPLSSQAVTYISQRGESMMALFMLLTLYTASRSFTACCATSRRGWEVAAVLACAMGMLSKQVMVVAPVLVLLYQWTFCRDTLRWRRWPLYLGLTATWIFVLHALGYGRFFVATGEGGTVGFGIDTLGAVDYAINQPLIVLHYLRLAILPVGLTFDYWWQPMDSVATIAAGIAGVTLLLVIVAVLLGRRSWAGFVAGAFFLILSPTSSVVPVLDLCVEHRAYLPCAAVMVLASAALWRLPVRVRLTLVAMLTVTLAGLTLLRNHDYRSEEALWRDTAKKRPNNPRAFFALGAYYASDQQWRLAVEHYDRVEAMESRFRPLYMNRALAQWELQRYERVVADTTQALRHGDRIEDALLYRGASLLKLNVLDAALRDLDEAIRRAPGKPYAYHWRSRVNERLNRPEAAAQDRARFEQLRQSAAPDATRVK